MFNSLFPDAVDFFNNAEQLSLKIQCDCVDFGWSFVIQNAVENP
jgi:hypothetical protein